MLKSLEHRVDDLIYAIEEDSKAEIKKINEETKSKISAILEAGKKEAEQIRAKILEEAASRANALGDEKRAEIQQKAKMQWLEKREKLLSEVFEAARSQFPKLLKSDDYAHAILDLTQEAVLHIQTDKVILHFDASSHSLITENDLSKLASSMNVQIEVGSDLTSGIGVIAQDVEGHRVFDNTLEARLDRMMSSLRSPVFKILMGEWK